MEEMDVLFVKHGILRKGTFMKKVDEETVVIVSEGKNYSVPVDMVVKQITLEALMVLK